MVVGGLFLYPYLFTLEYLTKISSIARLARIKILNLFLFCVLPFTMEYLTKKFSSLASLAHTQYIYIFFINGDPLL